VKKILSKYVLDLMSHVIEDSIPPEQIQLYLTTRIEQLVQQIVGQNLNVLSGKIAWSRLSVSVKETDKKDFENWYNSLDEKKLISKGIIKKGSGKYLGYLISNSPAEHKEFLKTSIEALIRHIEIKRKNSLANFDPEVAENDLWMERHDIAICLARYAEKFKEYRVLNTLYKLNDWAFPYYQKKVDQNRQIKYIHALSKQEKVSEELLK
jgi:hypothetical protein